MNQSASYFLSELKELQLQLHEHLTNDYLPLDARWDTFVQVSEQLLPHDGYISDADFPATRKAGMKYEYDEVFGFWEKNTTTLYKDLVDAVADSIEDYPKLDLNQWKEEILASGKSGFRNDW